MKNKIIAILIFSSALIYSIGLVEAMIEFGVGFNDL